MLAGDFRTRSREASASTSVLRWRGDPHGSDERCSVAKNLQFTLLADDRAHDPFTNLPRFPEVVARRTENHVTDAEVGDRRR
jgi:hypothetical protein